jgi:trimethylamine--corrinoid protein Co-methyltransferase
MMQSITDALHEATLRLLERTGVCIDSEAALDLLAAHGVRVDRQSRRVYPREEHVRAALASVPHRVMIYGRCPEQAVQLESGRTYVVSGGASLRVHTLDGLYEPATWEHLRRFNTLLDALPNIHVVVNQVDPTDEPTDRFYRRIAAEMLTTCRKPLLFQAAGAADVRAMIDMGAAIRGSRAALVAQPMFGLGLNAEPPLRIPKDVAEALIAASEAGMPVALGHYCMGGITAPITVAGAAVLINAVQMVAFVLSQLVHRGAPVCYCSYAGSGNMRTLDVVASNPHALRTMLLATALGHSYDLPVYALDATDARMPDPQAACERAVQLYALAEAGATIIQGATSSMDQFMLSSYAQAVIDNDIAGYVLAARLPALVSTDTLALDVTHEVLTDPWLEDLKFSAHPHTVRHIRDDLWEPMCFDYASFAAWQGAGGQSVVERAEKVARDILYRHAVEPMAPVLEAEIHRIAQG